LPHANNTFIIHNSAQNRALLLLGGDEWGKALTVEREKDWGREYCRR